MYRQLFAGHSNNERDRTYMFELKDDLHVCVLVLIDCDFANLRIQSTYYIKCILPFFIFYFFCWKVHLYIKCTVYYFYKQ